MTSNMASNSSFKAHKFAVNIGAKLGIAKYQEEKKRLKKHF